MNKETENFQKSQKDRILSCYKEADSIVSEDLLKSDTATTVKGTAKVIGQTKSAKPIYNIASHEAHQEYDSKDHKDAARLHKEIAIDSIRAHKAMNPGSAAEKMKMKADHHTVQAEAHEAQSTKIGDMETVKGDEFKHHRMMAGYHAVMGRELNNTAADLHSATDPGNHTIAKEKGGEASRHAKMEQFHAERAKKLHNPEKHGDWNNTIPKWEEAKAYGSKYAKDVDKKNPVVEEEEDSEDNVLEKDGKKPKVEVKKSDDEGSLMMSKGGPGSGKHIGDMSKEELHEQAEKMGIKGHKDMSAADLKKHLTDKNVDNELDKFKDAQKNLNDKVGVKETTAKNTMKKSEALDVLGVEVIEKGGAGSGRHPLNELDKDQVKHALKNSKDSELLRYTRGLNEAEEHVVNSLHDELTRRGGKPTFKKRKEKTE